jgi:hypothetical protein
MGILDDAIREHLELKRKHGVPEEEVERQEEEALGPARRDVAQQSEDGEIAADAVDDTSLFDGEHGDAPAAEAPAVGDDETAIAEPPATEEPLAAEAPPVEPVLEVAPEPEPHPEMEPTLVEPEPPAAEPPPEPDPHEALGDTEPHGFPAIDEDDDAGEVHEDHATEHAAEEEDSEDGDPAAEVDPEADVDDDELDVLEDTPDFLQETPEHDRLWFEQKPPRDFDFD